LLPVVWVVCTADGLLTCCLKLVRAQAAVAVSKTMVQIVSISSQYCQQLGVEPPPPPPLSWGVLHGLSQPGDHSN
jgi:hypothetical protein